MTRYSPARHYRWLSLVAGAMAGGIAWLGTELPLAYVPAARIVHHGGEASRKGLRHVAWFLRSAWRFFATHGWKIT